ncbi:hypothetical protein NKH77_12500 [Streptomyces sp. M19]
MNDLRALVDREPGPGTGPLAVRIPYPTKHGNLSLRSWLRAPHAEAGEIRVDGAGIQVHGTLHHAQDPDRWLAGAVAEARCRRDRALVRTAPLTVTGPRFVFTLAYADLAEPWQGGEDLWDLWLRPPTRRSRRPARPHPGRRGGQEEHLHLPGPAAGGSVRGDAGGPVLHGGQRPVAADRRGPVAGAVAVAVGPVVRAGPGPTDLRVTDRPGSGPGRSPAAA